LQNIDQFRQGFFSLAYHYIIEELQGFPWLRRRMGPTGHENGIDLGAGYLVVDLIYLGGSKAVQHNSIFWLICQLRID
jgi:hypothetical protein